MKKTRIHYVAALMIFGAVLLQEAVAVAAGTGKDDSPDARAQKLAGEAERNREMAEIWKEHVRTLTRQRDEAYKKIEKMKAQGVFLFESESDEPAADVAALTREKEAALIQIRDLKARVAALEEERGKNATQKITPLKAERRKNTTQKEIVDRRSDKNVFIGDRGRVRTRVQEPRSRASRP